MRARRLVGVLLLVSFSAGACDVSPGDTSAAGSERASAFHFRAPTAGKADGAEAGFLVPTELAQVQTALEQAIAATESKIRQLEADIAKLEADSANKLNEVNSLLSQIESRKRQIKSNLEAKQASAVISGIFGFFFPVAWVVTAASVAAAISDDQTLTSLQGSLTRARADRDALEAKRRDYLTRRDALRAELVPLKTAKAELIALLQGSPPAVDAQAQRPAGASPELDAAVWRVGVMRQILGNNQAQIVILTKIRTLAAELNASIDAALKTVRELAAAADKMLADSDAQIDELIALAFSPDPLAAAEAWLERIIAAKTKALLAYYGWPVDGFVDFLVKHRTSSFDGIVADLQGKLVDAITNAVLDVLLPTDPTPAPTDPIPAPTDPTEPTEPTEPTPAPGPASDTRVLLNEVVYDSVGSDANLYYELVGPPGTDLGLYTLDGINGAGGVRYLGCRLAGAIPADGRFLVVHTKATSATLRAAADLILNCDMQNGPDSIQLSAHACAATDQACFSDPSKAVVADALAYGTFAATETPVGEGLPVAAPKANTGMALTRASAGYDSDDNSIDWVTASPSYF